ncbi:hypothetical protein SPRG_03686 [Saprolegnia parasitica CBS 223.65]|uniref:JmjC domain-containing protein n=1 Tax=Saprolegnia parasitica (strain CBS 223.65) TaxID=695850 RepID=A0A067CZ34_SAPPC|nr:hypothetical protein SPRG_03686 [Saprolegnia parasitica CBS 223.65]KDO31766.1 hypothetical protein SPRG_03686 [Saprolegnia parasitica CBS 223.65]|eukprot:XP_012197646.1 hypothetical protein SPRG_03686 [Saprolegnia parasitica CBS 223.65]
MGIVRCVFCQKDKRIPGVGDPDVRDMRFCCQPSCFKAYHSRGNFVDLRHRELVAPHVILADIAKQRREALGIEEPRAPATAPTTAPPVVTAPATTYVPIAPEPQYAVDASGRVIGRKRQGVDEPLMRSGGPTYQSRHLSPAVADRANFAKRDGPPNDAPPPLWKQATYVASLDRFRRSLVTDDEHVLRVDLTPVYSGVPHARLEDAEMDCLLRCLEGTSSLTVLKGLVSSLNIELWTVINFLDSCSPNAHWSFAHFKIYKSTELPPRGSTSPLYYAGNIQLSIAEFRKYIVATQRAPASMVHVVDVNNKSWSIGLHEVLALGGLNLDLYCGEMAMDLSRQFAWSNILPGGADCWLQNLPAPYRHERFAPRMHCSFAGHRSELLQAGNGSTDVAYQVLHGELELIVFDQYPPSACLRLLDFLDRMGYQPHRRAEMLDKYLDNLQQLGYTSHKVRLQPGEYLHINRGRLHMWRSVHDPDTAQRGISMFLSWEWVYQGVTGGGMADAIAYSLQRLQRPSAETRPGSYVWDPRPCVIEAVRRLVAAVRSGRRSPATMLRLASLRTAFYAILQEEQRVQSDGDDSWFVHERHSDSHVTHTVDLGARPEHLLCTLCRLELGNSYKQCLGCMILAKKPATGIPLPPFKLCWSCFVSDADHHVTFEHQNGLRSGFGHTGALLHSKQYRANPHAVDCSCKHGVTKLCPVCDGCDACACICHTMFQTRYRALRPDELLQLYGAVSTILQANSSTLPTSTGARLH